MKSAFLIICLSSAGALLLPAQDFRSAGSGDWHQLTTWEQTTGAGWQAATRLPGTADRVSLQAGHQVQISAGDAGAAAVYIPAGAALAIASPGNRLTLYDGGAGADLLVEGTFEDGGSSNNGTYFENGATWQLGAGATFIKTNSSSAARYRDQHEGGMAAIPATAHWVIDKRGSAAPSFTTINSFYPNLTFLASAGSWDMAAGTQRIAGSSSTMIVAGDLTVGSGVQLYTVNNSGEPVSVQGSFYLQAGARFSNNAAAIGTGDAFPTGNGLAVSGDCMIDGTLELVSGGGLWSRSQGVQSISGSGSVTLAEWTVEGEVELQRPWAVDQQMRLVSGMVTLTSYDLTLYGDLIGGAAQSFIATTAEGSLVRPAGNGQTTAFPVGNGHFSPLYLSNSGAADFFAVSVSDQVWSQGDAGSPLTSEVLARNWRISEAVSGGNTLDVAVEWTGTDELPGFDRSDCYLAWYDGQGWQSGPAGTAAGADPYSLSGIQATTFPLALTVASSGLLPAVWGEFDVAERDTEHELGWVTWQEESTARFVAEHSTDGRRFRPIGSRPAAGHSEERRRYVFRWQPPAASRHYYRIRLEDYDGSYTWSPVRQLAGQSLADRLAAWPMPCRDRLYLRGLKTAETIRVCDRTGRELQRQSVGPDTALDLSPLPAGTCFLQFADGSVMPVIKQ